MSLLMKSSLFSSLINGKVEAYEVPLGPHSERAAEIFSFVVRWDAAHDQAYSMDSTDQDLEVGPNDMLKPDCCFRPK